MNIDSTDVKIMDLLQEDARISISELSKRINLSLSAVSERLKKLEQNGIIQQYTAIINPIAMHKELSVLMLVSQANTSDPTAIYDFVEKEDDILECHHVTGEYDYALRITTDNTASLERLMSEVKNIPSVRHCATIVILSTSKKKYSVSAKCSQ